MDKKYVVMLIVGLLLAIIFLFLPPKMIISWGFGFIRHNDRVMIGTIGLIVAVVSGYRLIKIKFSD